MGPMDSPMLSPSNGHGSPMGRCVPMLVVDAATGNTVGTAYGVPGQEGMQYVPAEIADGPIRTDTPDPSEASPMNRNGAAWLPWNGEQPMSPMSLQPLQAPEECGGDMMLSPLGMAYVQPVPVMGPQNCDAMPFMPMGSQSPPGGPSIPSPAGSPASGISMPPGVPSPHGSPTNMVMMNARFVEPGPPRSPQQFPVYAPPHMDFDGMNSNALGGLAAEQFQPMGAYRPGTQPQYYGVADMPEMPSEVQRADGKATACDSTTDESLQGGEQVASRSSHSE